jgi:hypothetical protein
MDPFKEKGASIEAHQVVHKPKVAGSKPAVSTIIVAENMLMFWPFWPFKPKIKCCENRPGNIKYAKAQCYESFYVCNL